MTERGAAEGETNLKVVFKSCIKNSHWPPKLLNPESISILIIYGWKK